MRVFVQVLHKHVAGLGAWKKDSVRDPFQAGDNRRIKAGASEPVYRHNLRKELLRLDRSRNPSCVDQNTSLDRPAKKEIGADYLPPSFIWECCRTKDLLKGIRLHSELQKHGFPEIIYADALITLYATCGCLKKAKELLDKHETSNIVPWTALISGYSRNGRGHFALGCFQQMQLKSIPLNEVTYLCVLKACAVSKSLDKGKQIHNEIYRLGLLECNTALGNAVVNMYAKCGALTEAQNVLDQLPFRNVFSWSALITGYAQNGQGHRALDCFEQMQHEGISPDVVTYVAIVNACAVVRDLDKGKKIHDEILRQGFLEHSLILGNALVDMYAKCGALRQARNILENLPTRNATSYSALVAGYSQQGLGQKALECFEQMQHEGIDPDAVTYVSIINACAVAGAIEKGKRIHDEILRKGLLKQNVVLGGALVDMYAKCGGLFQAQSVLENLPSRTVVSWNALITGYAQEGYSVQGLECIEQMQGEGIFPDQVTLLCLLNLCNHIGMVEKSQELFDNMRVTYGLKPSIECFTSIVDLFARCGQLVKAVDVIYDMPFSPNAAVCRCLWRCFLKMGKYQV